MSVQVPLGGPIALVPGRQLPERLHDLRLRFPYVPDLSGIQAELRGLAANGGVPATVTGGERLVVYGQDFFLSLYPSKMDDCYTVGYVDRLRCRDHDRLAKGVLLLRPQDWQLFGEFRDVPRGGYTNHWQPIKQAWHDLGATADRSPAAHTAYLDRVAQLAERTRDIEAAALDGRPSIRYRAVRATGEQRYTSRGVYLFELARSAQVTAGQLVQVDDDPLLRGKVLRLEGTELTVRFGSAIDFGRLRQQGTLREVRTDAVYRTQLQAVAKLREGSSANASLLPLLVDGEFTPFQPDRSAQPSGAPDPGQATAFAKACTVPDVLLVQGPPGTGKSWTIAEMARESAARGKQALVT
ncbi:MAG TPA: hypothetical protein VFX16_05100, partial [Pseudonocardiaceae bacterium]|nr:hypothetical protein [Pseudonocardiaceae bacterium]